jgi:hypothetical protein
MTLDSELVIMCGSESILWAALESASRAYEAMTGEDQKLVMVPGMCGITFPS